MPGLNGIKELADAELDGKSRYFSWRKAPTQVTTAGYWFDMSMSPGNPVPQYYASAPMVSVQMKKSDQGGIEHGMAVSPEKKYLKKLTVIPSSANIAMPMILCDYLLYYPFIEEGSLDEQAMTNSTTLPRYTDGAGVQIMAVSVASRTGGQSFQVIYTNQSGVSGRRTQIATENATSAIGNIVNGQTALFWNSSPFLTLQSGDTGVRSIEGFQMISGTDVGLVTLVLVKPLATMQSYGIDAPAERDFLLETGTMPEIKDDAFLGFVAYPKGSLSGTNIIGDIQIIYN